MVSRAPGKERGTLYPSAMRRGGDRFPDHLGWHKAGRRGQKEGEGRCKRTIAVHPAISNRGKREGLRTLFGCRASIRKRKERVVRYLLPSGEEKKKKKSYRPSAGARVQKCGPGAYRGRKERGGKGMQHYGLERERLNQKRGKRLLLVPIEGKSPRFGESEKRRVLSAAIEKKKTSLRR